MKKALFSLIFSLFLVACQMTIPKNDNERFTSLPQKADLLLYGDCMDSKGNIHHFQFLIGYFTTLNYSTDCYIKSTHFLFNYGRPSHYVPAWENISSTCGSLLGYELSYKWGIEPTVKDFKAIFLDYKDSSAVTNLITSPFKILDFAFSATLRLPTAFAITAIGSTCVFSSETIYVIAQPPVGCAFELTCGSGALLLGVAYQTLVAPLIIPFSTTPSPSDFSTYFIRTTPSNIITTGSQDEQRKTYASMQQKNLQALDLFQNSIIEFKTNHFNEMSQQQKFIDAANLYRTTASLPPTPYDLKILSTAGFSPPQIAAICDYLFQKFNL